jgi:FkbM family methyltransferase
VINLLNWARSRGEVDPADRPQSRFASEADIYFCFRLLLGRAPGPKEWHGHRLTAGTALDEIVAKFLASPEFGRRRLAAPSLSGTKHRLVDAQGIRLYISEEDKVCASLRVSGEYEPGVTALLRRVLRPGTNFVDVGANIGFFSVVASRLVGAEGRVFAVEPYPYNVKLLLANLALNRCRNVEVFPFAAASAPQVFCYDDSAGNSGQILEPSEMARLDDCLVSAMPLDRLIPGDCSIQVVKMDVEGAEYLALQGMKKTCSAHRPLLISEIAADFLRDVSKASLTEYLMALLVDEGYRLAIIGVDGTLHHYRRDIPALLVAYEKAPGMCLDIVAFPENAAVISPQ